MTVNPFTVPLTGKKGEPVSYNLLGEKPKSCLLAYSQEQSDFFAMNPFDSLSLKFNSSVDH